MITIKSIPLFDPSHPGKCPHPTHPFSPTARWRARDITAGPLDDGQVNRTVSVPCLVEETYK